MYLIPYVITYLGLIFFISLIVFRIFRFQRMPLNLRWELYPIPHEGKGRSKYGGSYFEEICWWAKPLKKSPLNILKTMIPEMLFLVAVFKHNRKLWYCSFPFHFGIYLLIFSLLFIIFKEIMQVFLPLFVINNETVSLFQVVSGYLFLIGLILFTLGSVGLFLRRVFNPDLRPFTNPADVFNLCLFLIESFLLWGCFFLVDNNQEILHGFVLGVLTINPAPLTSQLFTLVTIFTILLVCYVPTTHMAHFFLKWFTYHDVRWDDRINKVGSSIEKKISSQLGYPVSWAGNHIKQNGLEKWGDLAKKESSDA